MDVSEAAILAAISLGSVTKALGMREAGWIRRRSWLIQQAESLNANSMVRSLAFARQLSEDKNSVEDALEILKTWYRDLAVWPHRPGRIVNRDLAEIVEIAASRQPPGNIQRVLTAIETAQKQLRANTNPRVTLEVLAMKMIRQDR